MARGRATLAELIDLQARLRGDAELTVAQVRDRDRRIGRKIDPQAGAEAQLLEWLEHVTDEGAAGAGQRVAAAHRLGRFALGLLGLVLGAGAAAAVFYYDGAHPVNVLYVLGIFIGINWALLAVWVVAMLPTAWRRFVPGLGGVLEALETLSPGRWVAAGARWLPQNYRETLLSFHGSVRGQEARYGRVSKWAAAEASQVFAVMFYAAVVATCLGLVTFKDMAFGWSTTLDVSPRQVQLLTSPLAQPWVWAWPQAAPDAELIERTQYYRWHEGRAAVGNPTRPDDPRRWGGWWPFVLMSLVVYGLVPRIVTCAIARVLFIAAVRHAFIHAPGAYAVLERLRGPLVRTAGEGVEHPPPRRGGATPLEHAPGREMIGRAVLINWAGAAGEDDTVRGGVMERVGAGNASLLEAGGAHSPQHDARTIEAASRVPASRIIVLVRAWEPPTGDIEDFLRALRQAAGKHRPIDVAPVMFDQQGDPVAPREADLAQWRQALGTLGDPYLAVLDTGSEGA